MTTSTRSLNCLLLLLEMLEFLSPNHWLCFGVADLLLWGPRAFLCRLWSLLVCCQAIHNSLEQSLVWFSRPFLSWPVELRPAFGFFTFLVSFAWRGEVSYYGLTISCQLRFMIGDLIVDYGQYIHKTFSNGFLVKIWFWRQGNHSSGWRRRYYRALHSRL